MFRRHACSNVDPAEALEGSLSVGSRCLNVSGVCGEVFAFPDSDVGLENAESERDPVEILTEEFLGRRLSAAAIGKRLMPVPAHARVAKLFPADTGETGGRFDV